MLKPESLKEPVTEPSSKRQQQTLSPRAGGTSANLSNEKKARWLELDKQQGEREGIKSEKLSRARS